MKKNKQGKLQDIQIEQKRAPGNGIELNPFAQADKHTNKWKKGRGELIPPS